MSPSDFYVPALRFRALTPAYDALVRLTTRERAFKPALVAQARISPGHRVLDLGCGTGTLALLVKRQQPDAEVTGIDGDPEILGIAKRKARRARADVSLDLGLSFELPYEDAHFDRVLTTLFFHHLSAEDKLRTAAELARVIKPGGELHVADWGRPANALLRLLHRPVQWLDGFANTQDNVEGRLMPMLESAGFTDLVEHRHFNTVLGTLRCFSAARPPRAPG